MSIVNISSDAKTKRNTLLQEIQDRVLWLSVQMVDYANNSRPSDGVKVGGHQSSSASVVTIMTYLYFEFMNSVDKISIKPHASPVFHAIQFLLGNLAPEYLRELRAFHGLQAYPSRTKDPDKVDFSSGSVGLGAVAPNFAWLTDQYIRSHIRSDMEPDRKFISLLGDAELDEGVVWESIAEPLLSDMDRVIWIVDLNRQSLDRIIPGIRVKVWQDMFNANGWKVVEAKYGRLLNEAFSKPKGELLKQCIDKMSNEMYHRLIRAKPQTMREWLPYSSDHPDDLSKFISQWDDEQLPELLRDLGGHDFDVLRNSFCQIDDYDGPSVLFAYTLKGWKLPSMGDPHNHSVNLNSIQMDDLRAKLGIDKDNIYSGLDSNKESGQLCLNTGYSLQMQRGKQSVSPSIHIPQSFDRTYPGMMSTQQMFGLVLTEIHRTVPKLAERMVTVSPDVASSTNLGGWINKAAIWSKQEKEVLPEEDQVRALQWIESPNGQHIELGISENNLFLCLGQLGLSQEMLGELLFPIGTLYDPFVRRGLDALVYSVSSGSKFLFVGTPSGITLSPEGGSHQSLITPSIGIELPELAFYEPCFGQELEWIILSSLENIRTRKESTYLRLTSKKIDQTLFKYPNNQSAIEELRHQVINGAYRLIDHSQDPNYRPNSNVVHIFASGAIVPEAINASKTVLKEGIFANVINVTGPGPLYQDFQNSVRQVFFNIENSKSPFLEDVIPINERGAPVVTVVDGHPHSLSWIGGALGTHTFPLGVTEFGQSGNPSELYKEYEIDSDSITAACFGALGY